MEDWLTPDELARPEGMDQMVTAWCRYQRARTAWLSEQEIPPEVRCAVIPFGQPVYRGRATTAPARSRS